MDIIKYNNNEYYVSTCNNERLECYSMQKYNPFSVEKCKYYKTFEIIPNDKYYDNGIKAFNDNQAGKMFNDETYMRNLLAMFELYRRVLKYAYDNNAYISKQKCYNPNYRIVYSENFGFEVEECPNNYSFMDIIFNNEEVARKCIDDIIKPFVNANKLMVI